MVVVNADDSRASRTRRSGGICPKLGNRTFYLHAVLAARLLDSERFRRVERGGKHMDTIYFDSPVSEQTRRQCLYEGQLFIFSPRPSSIALCEFADELIRGAFGSLSPERAQYSLPVEEYAATLAQLKPVFINHPKSKEYIQAILNE